MESVRSVESLNRFVEEHRERLGEVNEEVLMLTMKLIEVEDKDVGVMFEEKEYDAKYASPKMLVDHRSYREILIFIKMYMVSEDEEGGEANVRLYTYYLCRLMVKMREDVCIGDVCAAICRVSGRCDDVCIRIIYMCILRLDPNCQQRNTIIDRFVGRMDKEKVQEILFPYVEQKRIDELSIDTVVEVYENIGSRYVFRHLLDEVDTDSIRGKEVDLCGIIMKHTKEHYDGGDVSVEFVYVLVMMYGCIDDGLDKSIHHVLSHQSMDRLIECVEYLVLHPHVDRIDAMYSKYIQYVYNIVYRYILYADTPGGKYTEPVYDSIIRHIESYIIDSSKHDMVCIPSLTILYAYCKMHSDRYKGKYVHVYDIVSSIDTLDQCDSIAVGMLHHNTI